MADTLKRLEMNGDFFFLIEAVLNKKIHMQATLETLGCLKEGTHVEMLKLF